MLSTREIMFLEIGGREAHGFMIENMALVALLSGVGDLMRFNEIENIGPRYYECRDLSYSLAPRSLVHPSFTSAPELNLPASSESRQVRFLPC